MTNNMSKWLYETNSDNSARYVLGERGDNPLVCIGVNPSTAEPDKLDPTLRNVKRFAESHGFEGWIMLNLYPQRATNPNDLHAEPCDEYMDRNAFWWNWLFDEFHWATIWAAWGTLIEKRDYMTDCLRRLAKTTLYDWRNCNWVTIGKRSQAGHPHHPLYLPKTAQIQTFDIQTYLKNLKGSD